jgi:hypothetical protein
MARIDTPKWTFSFTRAGRIVDGRAPVNCGLCLLVTPRDGRYWRYNYRFVWVMALLGFLVHVALRKPATAQ